jgi:hypothetical protein
MAPLRTRSKRSESLALVLMVICAGLWSFGASAQGTEPPAIEWGEDQRLSESSEVSDDPVVALTPTGGMAIAWRERWFGSYSVFFMVLDAQGSTEVDRRQLGDDIPSSMDPVVAVDSRGRMYFVWTGQSDQELYYARTEPDGDIDIGPKRLTNATGDSAEASLWIDRRDHLHLVWFDGRNATSWLYYMQLDPEGRKVVGDTPLTASLTEQESAIAMDSRGDIHVVWNGIAPPGQLQWNWELHYTKLSNQGEVQVRDRLVATSRGSIGYPDLAVDLSDHVHVVWSEGTAAREMVKYAELDSSGRPVVDPLEVSSPVVGAARDVTVAIDGNDRLHVVWSGGIQGASDLVFQTLMPGGEPLNVSEQLTDAPGDSREPSIVLSPKGEPRVVWSDWRSGNAEIYLKVASKVHQGIDLSIYASGITFVPETPATDDQVTVTAQVHNDGTEVSPAFRVSFRIDGENVGQANVPALDPGRSYEAEVVVGTLAEGDHEVRVEVDPEDRIEEVDETNNDAERTLTVYPSGLLVVDAGPDQQVFAGETVYLDGTGTVYRGEGILSYQWDFGDGSTGLGLYAEHVYGTPGDYDVTLTVSDGEVTGTDTTSVEVLEPDDPPRAVIDPSGPLTADRLAPLVLSAELSTDDAPDWPTGARFVWDLGDGNIAQGARVSHQYIAKGLYVVTLTVTDSVEQIDVNRTTVEVVNIAPEVLSITEDLKVDVGEGFTLSVEARDADGTVSTIGWDLDARDGINFDLIGAEVDASYDQKGDYIVTCIVRDNDGGQTIASVNITVKEETGVSSIPGTGGPMAILAAAIASISVAVSRTGGKTIKKHTTQYLLKRLNFTSRGKSSGTLPMEEVR